MQKAEATELREVATPVLQAHLPENELHQLLPVEMDPLDPLCEAEPSIGALIRLVSGELIVVVYGTETGTLSLLIPSSKPVRTTLNAVLDEIPIRPDRVSWRADQGSKRSAAI